MGMGIRINVGEWFECGCERGERRGKCGWGGIMRGAVNFEYVYIASRP